MTLSFNRKDGADYTFELTLEVLGVVNPVVSVDIEAFENGWSLLSNTSTLVSSNLPARPVNQCQVVL